MDDDLNRAGWVAAPSAVIALVLATLRGVIAQKYGGLVGWLRGIFASLIVAVLVGFYLEGTNLPTLLKWAIVGTCAFLADDVLAGMLVLGSLFRNDPREFFRSIVDIFRGSLGNGGKGK